MASLALLQSLSPASSPSNLPALSSSSFLSSSKVKLIHTNRKSLTVVSGFGDVSPEGTNYLLAGAVAVALLGTAFPIVFSRKDVKRKHTTSRGAAAATMGVEKEILKAGKGPKPIPGQSVTVHCTGFGKNGDLGEKFWSTKDWGQKPFTFEVGLGQVIKGWDEGVMGMQVGEVARLQCSPDYGYGPSGFPAWGIEPNSVLVFEIEVLSLQ